MGWVPVVVLTGATRGIGRADDAAALTGEYVEDEKVVAPSAQAQDDALARNLWEQSAQLVSVPTDARA